MPDPSPRPISTGILQGVRAIWTITVSLALLTLCACAPTAEPARTATDALFEVRAEGQRATSSAAGGFVYRTPAYTLRYYLGSHPEGVTPSSITLELTNTGERDVRILWEESRFTYPSGAVSRPIHQGVPYAARMEAPPPTTVRPGERHRDRAVPSGSLRRAKGSFQVIPLYRAERAAESAFTLTLALEVGGEKETVALEWRGRGALER